MAKPSPEPTAVVPTAASTFDVEGFKRLQSGAADLLRKEDESRIIELTPQERARKWAVMGRTLTPDVPEADARYKIKERWGHASSKMKNDLFALWLECEEDWGRVIVMEEIYRESKVAGVNEEEYMTKSQVAKHYAGDVDLADTICQKKKEQGSWRWHPELPLDEKAIQYLVLVKTMRRRMEIRVSKTSIQMKAELKDKDTVKALVGNRGAALKENVMEAFVDTPPNSHPASAVALREQIEKELQTKADAKKKEEEDARRKVEQEKAALKAERDAERQRLQNEPLQKAKTFRTALARDLERVGEFLDECRLTRPDLKEACDILAEQMQSLSATATQIKNHTKLGNNEKKAYKPLFKQANSEREAMKKTESTSKQQRKGDRNQKGAKKKRKAGSSDSSSSS